MRTVRLKLGERSYPIIVGRGAAQKALGTLGRERGRTAIVLADRNLSKQARAFERMLKSRGWKTTRIECVANEAFKDIRKIYPIYGKLLHAGADRHSVLFALGGGVIGDAAGFIAASYMRGIRWVGLPTTLLAQVDSSIGGKTGVNHPAGKNLIGAFHQPSLVACDLDYLATLPKRERVSGLGEMIKYALIYDPSFFKWLNLHWKGIAEGRAEDLEAAVTRCAKWKALAVARDERDARGVREVLNFGHTVGHALEAGTRYQRFRHGEAIILGMRAAVALSVIRGHLDREAARPVERLLRSIPVPKVPSGLSGSRLLALIRKDKKAKAGRVRFVLLKGLGRTILDSGPSEAEILRACQTIRS